MKYIFDNNVVYTLSDYFLAAFVFLLIFKQKEVKIVSIRRIISEIHHLIMKAKKCKMLRQILLLGTPYSNDLDSKDDNLIKNSSNAFIKDILF